MWLHLEAGTTAVPHPLPPFPREKPTPHHAGLCKAAVTTGDQEKAVDNMSREEREAMAKDVKQRMAGLYAVLGVCVFFWKISVLDLCVFFNFSFNFLLLSCESV